MAVATQKPRTKCIMPDTLNQRVQLSQNFIVCVVGNRKVRFIWIFGDVGRSTSFHGSHTDVFTVQEKFIDLKIYYHCKFMEGLRSTTC